MNKVNKDRFYRNLGWWISFPIWILIFYFTFDRANSLWVALAVIAALLYLPQSVITRDY